MELLTSAYAVEEARRNLEEESQRARLARLLGKVRVVGEAAAARQPGETNLPAKDRPILASAAAAGASHLLTGDKQRFGRHFGRRVEGVLVLPPGEYLSGRA